MYIPPFNKVDDEDTIRAMVRAAAAGWFITADEDGVPTATLIPVMWDDDTVIAHMAIANPHWRSIRHEHPTLIVCPGPDAYVSPSWYAAKAEHGRVVPTWNYTAVHLTGTAQVHRDDEWLRKAVADLTDVHEAERPQPWEVTDAPDDYVNGQLRGIVGIEVTVTAVEAKSKLSQNRSAADQEGVVDGLRAEGDRRSRAVADAMSTPDQP